MCRIRGEVPCSLFVYFLRSILSAASISDDGVWTRQDPKSIGVTGTRDIVPQAYGTFRINSEMLKGVLRQAPLRIFFGRKNPQCDSFDPFAERFFC